MKLSFAPNISRFDAPAGLLARGALFEKTRNVPPWTPRKSFLLMKSFFFKKVELLRS